MAGRRILTLALVAVAAGAVACGSGSVRPAALAGADTATSSTSTSTSPPSVTDELTTTSAAAPDGTAVATTTSRRPTPPTAARSTTTAARAVTSTVPPAPWVLGATPLNRRPDGFGEILPTPPALVDRRLQAPDVLPPPADGAFHSTIVPLDDDAVARAGWVADCPVALDGLRDVTVGFWGFDGRAHTGEIVVATKVAPDVVIVFSKLFAAHFPLEDLRPVRPDAEAGKAPTGDGNTSGGFSCRPKRGSTSWSSHAYGIAIDINPFQNPYSTASVVLPERASAYLDRSDRRPGMIADGDVVTKAFAAIGWSWGGRWHSPTDRMHFSLDGH